MARQFQGAAKGRGFNPIPISGANITRMREENERILRGMRERRESERNNEKRQLEAMQADAAYYEKVRARDFKVESTNLANEQKQLQYNEAERVAQYNAETKAISGIFDDIVKFSRTAAAAKAKADEKREVEAAEEARRLRERNGPLSSTDIAFRSALDAEAEGQELVRGSVQEAKELGAPEYEVQKTLGLTYKQSVAYVEHDAKLATQAEWPAFRAQWFSENAPDALASPEQANALLFEAWKEFEQQKGWTEYSAELLGTALDAKATSDQTFISGITTRATARITGENITALTNAALADWNNQGAASFRGVGTVKDYSTAHTWYKQQALAMDENGNFILSDSQWMNTDVRGDGTAYFTGNPKEGFYARGLDILNAREEKRRQWNSSTATDDRQSYQEESKAWHRHIVVDGNNTPEDFAAAAASFKDNVQGKPEWLTKLEAAGDPANAESNANLLTMAKDLEARGMLNQSLVDKIFEFDPVQANTLQESLNEQNPFLQSDQYVDLREVTTNLTKTTLPGGGLSTDTPTSYIASNKLGKIYDGLVRQEVANGASIEAASATASQAIAANITTDAGNPDGTYHRVYNAALGVYEYPNLLDQEVVSIVEKSTTDKTLFAEKLNAGDVSGLFDKKDTVMTDADFNASIAAMQKPGFEFPARVQMVAEKTGSSPFTIMQRVASAKGMPEIEPPPSMKQLGMYSPKAQALITRFQSTNRNARGNGIGIGEVGSGWNVGAVPENLREFYRTSAEKYGVSPAENSAMGEIESGHAVDPKNRVSYNGSSFGVMQINKAAHPDFFAQFDGKNDDEANIDYGTQYYASLKRQYNGDAIAAAMAYNGGPGNYNMWVEGETPDWIKTDKDLLEWNRIVNEMTNHGKKFAKAYYKYSGDASLLQHPILLRK